MEARTVEGKESRNQRLHTVGSPGKSVGAKRGEKWGPEITKKAQDELVASSFLKKKHNAKENLDVFPIPLKSSGQNRIHGQIPAAKRRANAEIMRAQIGGPGQ